MTAVARGIRRSHYKPCRKPTARAAVQFVARHLFADPSAVGVHLETYDPNSILRRRNLLTYSEEFGGSAYTRTATVVTDNAVAAPDGTMTADKVAFDATNASHYISYPTFSTLRDNSDYTSSCYLKAAEQTQVEYAVQTKAGSFITCLVNLTTGALSPAVNPALGVWNITDEGNGWWRLSVKFNTASGGGNVVGFRIFNLSSATRFGDGVSSYYAWGAQFELGDLTAYQKVTDWNTEFLAAGGDRVTLWQDVARTIPVWAVEQSIASIRDTSRPGSTVYVTQPTSGFQAKLKARVNQLVATETLATQSATTLATNYVLRFTGSGTVTLSGTSTSGALSAGTHNITCTAGSLTLTVAGTVTQADLRTSADAALNIPAYQAVRSATDYDTDGFPHRRVYDGSDDFDSFSLALSGCSKVDVFIDGLLKQSDAAPAVLVEHTANSGTTAGGFGLFAPVSTGNANYAGRSFGSVVSTATSSTLYPAPQNGVLAMSADIATDAVAVELNGTQVASSSADQGTGNYATDTCYIGARAGSSLRSGMGWCAITIVGSPTANVSAGKRAQRVRWGMRRAKII